MGFCSDCTDTETWYFNLLRTCVCFLLCFISCDCIYSPYFSSFIEVNSQELESGAGELQFTVRVNTEVSVQRELYCCQYKNQEDRFSAFSPYLELEHQTGITCLSKI